MAKWVSLDTVQAEIARSLGRWEPRLKLSRVNVLAVVDGRVDMVIYGEYLGESVLIEVTA